MGISQFTILCYNNFIGQLRQVKRNVMLFVIPILIFLFVYLFFRVNKVEETFIEPLTVGVIVEDESPYSDLVAQGLLNTKDVTEFVKITQGDYEQVNELFEAGQLDAMVLMPDGFIDSVMHFESNPVQVKVNYKDPLKAVLIRNIIYGYESYITSVETGIITLQDQMELREMDEDLIDAYNESISIDLLFTALDRSSFYTYKEIVDVPSVASTLYYLIAIVVMFLMYISVFSGINLIRERDDMCIKRLRLSKVRLWMYILSKAISNTLFIGMMVLVWLLIFVLGTGGSISRLLPLCGFILVAIFFDVCLALWITSCFKRDESVVLFANVFIFINAVIGGSIIPLHMMPDIVSKIARVSPNYWMIRGALYMQSGFNINEGFVIMALMTFISIVLLLVTSFTFDNSKTY